MNSKTMIIWIKFGIIAFFLCLSFLNAIDYHANHEVLVEQQYQNQTEDYQLLLQYKPKLWFDLYEINSTRFNGEIEGDFSLTYNNDWDHDFDFYRHWLRMESIYYEIRIGKQKINFGSALIYRPLQWFDTIDPTDALARTRGIDALLFRYYLPNNSIFWMWGMLGKKEEQKQWEILASDHHKPEFGFRMQLSFDHIESALSTHLRELEIPEGYEAFLRFDDLTEYRFGFDTKWNWVIGCWLESAVFKNKFKSTPFQQIFQWQHLTTVGIDYTFPIQNGLYVCAEHLFLRWSETDFWSSAESLDFTAVQISYPINFLDQIRGILQYDWDEKKWTQSYFWERMYDKVGFFLTIHHHSYESVPSFFERGDKGTTLQFTVQWNR